MSPEKKIKLDNQVQQEEDVTWYTPVYEQRLWNGHKTALGLADRSSNDSDIFNRTNSQQQIQQPIDAVNKKLVELLGLTDGQILLTEDQLKKLNEILESNLLGEQEMIDFLIQRGIHINYQDYADKTKGEVIYRCNEFIENSFSNKPVLNENLGDINEINNIIQHGINFEDPINIDDFLTSTKQVFLLKTENTLLSILSIYESLIIKNKNYSIQDSYFLKLHSYIEKQDKINDLLYSAAGKMLCIRYPYNSDNRRLSGVLEILNTLLEVKSDKKIIFIIPESNTKEFNEIKRVFNNKCYKEATDHKFTLSVLTEDSQQKLLEQDVILQGEKIRLNKLIDKSDKNAKQIIDAETLERLITNKVIKIGSRPLGTVGLEGAYSYLNEEVNMEAFVDKLLSEESSDIYIISGIPSIIKENKLIEYLVNADIDINKKSKVNDLRSRIAVLNQDTTRAINKRIQIADDQFKIIDFKLICQSNWERKIYWINLKHEGSVSKFMLEQIYNPDFYLKDNRFHNRVVIEKTIKLQLASNKLTEIYIIGGKSEEEVWRWLQLCRAEELVYFRRNCNNNKILCLNSQDNISAIFQKLVAQNDYLTFHLLKFEQEQLIWCKTHGSLWHLSKYRGNTKCSIGADALITKIKDDKGVIIAGNPGVGKTTALVKLYELQYTSRSGAKESIIKSHWLITVNLKNHLDAINNTDFTISTEIVKRITDFLLQVDKSISDGFARMLLGMALVKQDFGKPLLIVLDGFDELSNKKDRDKVISLLKCLKNETKAKFWITTNLHYVHTLEGIVSTFAIKLNTIDDDTTSELIKKHLKNNLSLILNHEEFQNIFGNSDEIIENTRVQEFTKALLSKMHDMFKDDMFKYIGTPLQLCLVLEGSARYFKVWTQDVNSQSPDFNYLGNDLWEVYENFLTRKYSIHLKQFEKQLTEDQETEAFDNYYKSLIVKSIREESIEKFRNTEYLHSTYIDYFAATLCLQSKGSLQKSLMQEILENSDHQIIRTFLNSKLLKEKIENIIHLQEIYYYTILLEAVHENNIRIANFVLDISSRIVEIKNNHGRTVLYTPIIFGNLDMVKFLVNEKNADLTVKDNRGMTVLYLAGRIGNLEIAKFLIDKGADINAKDHYNAAVLHATARSGNVEIVKLLIAKGANVDVKDNSGMTVLHMAAASGNMEMIKFLINEKWSNIDTLSYFSARALHEAVFSGNLETVKFMVDEKGDDFEAVSKDGCSVVYMAAASGNLNMLKYLANEKGANVHNKNHNGVTVLHAAASYGNLDMIKFLVNEKKADFNAKNNTGKTVLHMAAYSGNLDKVKFLVKEKMADINAKDIFEVSVLDMAVHSNNLALVKYLIDSGVNIHTEDQNRITPLQIAAKYGNVEIVKCLLDKGVNVNAKDIKGMTALHKAAESGNLELVIFLINEMKFDFHTKENKRNTILHAAISSGNLELVKFLVLKKRVNVYTIDKNGMSVLEAAVNFGNLAIVKFLINERNIYFRAKDNDGRSILHKAAHKGNLKIVEFLVNEKWVDFNDKDKHGITVLHLAARSNNIETFKFLVNKGANVYARSNCGITVLHLAASCNTSKIVKYLVNEKQFDINAIDNSGVPVVHVAARSGNLNTIKFLLDEKKADFTVKDCLNTSILFRAVQSGNLMMVKYLVDEKKVDFSVNDVVYEPLMNMPSPNEFSHIIDFLKDRETVALQAKL